MALSATERAVLQAVPAAQLRELARQLPPPPAPRRAQLRRTAATAVVLLGGAALAGCGPGCQPDAEQAPSSTAPAEPPPPALPESELVHESEEVKQAQEDAQEVPPPRIHSLPAIGGAMADEPEECD